MGLRKGEYVGFWCPPDLKKKLSERAAAEYRSLSQEVVKRLDKSVSEEETGAGREQKEEGEK